MKAVVLRQLGDPDNLRVEDVRDPEPDDGTVIVRLSAAALNHRDVWIRRGQYAGINLPVILGSDGSGKVIAVGASVDPGLVGTSVVIDPSIDWGDTDRVQGAGHRIIGLADDGTYAELVRVPAVNIHPKPATLSFEEAAALPTAAVTAYRAVITRGRVRADETVLITGIGGGVATFALQIARHVGARVLATSSSDQKLAKARTLGAFGVANYRDTNWHTVVRTMADGKGPDVVVDSGGGETFAKAIEILRPGGRLVTYGATAGAAKLEVRRIFFKQLDVLGSTMGTPSEFVAMLKLFSEGGLRPTIDRAFELHESADAHRRLEDGAQFGKIVLRIH